MKIFIKSYKYFKIEFWVLAIIIASILFSVNFEAKAYFDKSESVINPGDLIGPVPRTFSHRTATRPDNTGGLHLSSPVPGKLRYSKGPDVLNPCAFYGMTFTDEEMCKQLNEISVLSYTPNTNPSAFNNALSDIRDLLGLNSGANNCYDFYRQFYNTLSINYDFPITVSEEDKKRINMCHFYCNNAEDTKLSRAVCGIDKCINILNSNAYSSEMGQYCHYIVSRWGGRTEDTEFKKSSIGENIFSSSSSNRHIGAVHKEDYSFIFFRNLKSKFLHHPVMVCLNAIDTKKNFEPDLKMPTGCYSKDSYRKVMGRYLGANSFDEIKEFLEEQDICS